MSYWFDIAGFARQASYTRRTNPWYYDGLTGPGFMNLDLSLSNRFALSERFELGLRIDAFNALNGMNWVTPQLNEAASHFGKTYTQPTTAVRFSTPSVLSSERTSRGGRTTSDPLSMAP